MKGSLNEQKGWFQQENPVPMLILAPDRCKKKKQQEHSEELCWINVFNKMFCELQIYHLQCNKEH